jgi:DUF2934 family protein
MKLKDKRNEIQERHTSAIQFHAEVAAAQQPPSHEEISLRAYEIHLERGGLPDCELDDWLQAERELESAALRKATGFSIKAEDE